MFIISSTLFCILTSFLRLSIHTHIVLRFSFIIFQQCFFTIYFSLYLGVSWKFQAPGDYRFLFRFFVHTTVILKTMPRNETQVLFHCSYFEKNEISFWVIKCYVNNTLIWNLPKETSAHANMMETYYLNCCCGKCLYWIYSYECIQLKQQYKVIHFQTKIHKWQLWKNASG